MLGESAKAMIGTWEFSNAARDKVCNATFKKIHTRVGFRVTFGANCGKLFPLVQQVAGWRYPEDDDLFLLDADGKALVEFSEVEDGIFEAPTPGVGVLFLQNPAAIERDKRDGADSPDNAGNPPPGAEQLAPVPPEDPAPEEAPAPQQPPKED